MTAEAHQIAARLAAASEVFPIKQADGWDSRADASAEGDVLTIVVTDHLGRAKREYRAVIQLVAEEPPSDAPQ
jgi:hypothetical protein